MKKKKTPAPRKSGSAAMAEAGLKQGNYWLSAEDNETLRQAAEIRGQSIMSYVQHLIRTGSQKEVHDHEQKNA